MISPCPLGRSSEFVRDDRVRVRDDSSKSKSTPCFGDSIAMSLESFEGLSRSIAAGVCSGLAFLTWLLIRGVSFPQSMKPAMNAAASEPRPLADGILQSQRKCSGGI